MRGVAYALTASVALMFGALTQASAGCYGGDCNGYQGDGYYGGERTYYEGSRYYDSGSRGTTVYYERGPEIQTGYYERPLYRGGYGADYNGDGYADSAYGYRGNGYGLSEAMDTTEAMATAAATAIAAMAMAAAMAIWLRRLRLSRRLWLSRLWHMDGGYGYRGYGYGGYGYGYPRRLWLRLPSVLRADRLLRRRLLQTAGALGYGGYGCSAAYIPYGWHWHRATSC